MRGCLRRPCLSHMTRSLFWSRLFSHILINLSWLEIPTPNPHHPNKPSTGPHYSHNTHTQLPNEARQSTLLNPSQRSEIARLHNTQNLLTPPPPKNIHTHTYGVKWSSRRRRGFPPTVKSWPRAGNVAQPITTTLLAYRPAHTHTPQLLSASISTTQSPLRSRVKLNIFRLGICKSLGTYLGMWQHTYMHTQGYRERYRKRTKHSVSPAHSTSTMLPNHFPLAHFAWMNE